jgi:hypothetical protein
MLARIGELLCNECGGKVFGVVAGCARARCLNCRAEMYIADSDEYAEEAELIECACPCKSEAFAVGVGFALREDGDVRWISVGLRCVHDGTLGVYADWKIDYSPTSHLLVGTTEFR